MVPFICNFRGENNKAPRFYLGALNPAERTELSVYSPAYHIKLIITHNQAFTYLLI